MKKKRRNKTKGEKREGEGEREREEHFKGQARVNVTYSELLISGKYEKADSQGE
jgi:hypothetical protein